MEDRSPTLLVLNAVFFGTMSISMLLRVWARLGVIKSWGIDDTLMSIAVLFYGIYLSCSIWGLKYGTGRHFSDIPLEDYMTAMKAWWFCYPFYAAVMIFTKLSIGYFLLRVTVKPFHKWVLYLTMVVTLCAGLAFFIGCFLQCRPISFFWTRYSVPGGPTSDTPIGFCIDPTILIALAYLYSVFAIFSDLTMALFPVLLISALNMNRQLKILLIPLMAMGTTASLGLVVRLPWLMNLRNIDDFLYSTADIVIWSTVEGGLAITAGNLATTRPLWRAIAAKLGFTILPTGVGDLDPLSGEPGYGLSNKGWQSHSTLENASHKKSRSGSVAGGAAHAFNSAGLAGGGVSGIAGRMNNVLLRGGEYGAYPLSDIDDQSEAGDRSNRNSASNNKNSSHSHHGSGSRRGSAGGASGSGKDDASPGVDIFGANYFTSHGRRTSKGNANRWYGHNSNNSSHKHYKHNASGSMVSVSREVISTISSGSAPRRKESAGSHDENRDSMAGFYSDGRPYGLRTQIVAAANRDHGIGRNLGPSESQEDLYATAKMLQSGGGSGSGQGKDLPELPRASHAIKIKMDRKR